jgi:hypothetical protein
VDRVRNAGTPRWRLRTTKRNIAVPIAVWCKHMKAANVRCGFSKEITPENQATMLPHELWDNDQKDLASVGGDLAFDFF